MQTPCYSLEYKETFKQVKQINFFKLLVLKIVLKKYCKSTTGSTRLDQREANC